MARVEYGVALVTYIDILGFRELIKTKSVSDISRILRLVKEAVRPAFFKTPLKEVPADQYVNFSDLTVISTPLEKPHNPPGSELFFRLLQLVHAQSRLAIDEGILIRGAVTLGFIVKSQGLLFGPALVRAYELEQHVAKHPRIIIDKAIFRILDGLPGAWLHDKQTNKADLRRLMRKDDDGQLFVDYLWAARNEVDDPSVYPIFLDRHRKLIEERLELYAQNRDIRRKYKWLKRYHRETIARINKRRRS